MAESVIEPILTEAMVQHGIEVLLECRAAKKNEGDTVKAVYLSMEAIRQLTIMRDNFGTAH